MSVWISTRQWTKAKGRLPKNIQVIKRKKAATKIRYGKKAKA